MLPLRHDPQPHHQKQRYHEIKKLSLVTETVVLAEEEAEDEERVTRMSREREGGWRGAMPEPRKVKRSPSLSTKLPKWRNRAAVSGLKIGSSTQYPSPTLLSPSSTSTRRDMTIPSTTTMMPGMGMRAVSGSHVPHSSVSATAWSTSGASKRGEKRRRASISVTVSVGARIERKSAALRNSVQYWLSSAASGGDNRYQKISPHHQQT